MSTTANSTTAIDDTEIRYDRLTKDFAILFDGQVIGYAPNYSQAEAKRTQFLAERHELENVTDPPSDPLPDDAPGQDIDGVPYPRWRGPLLDGYRGGPLRIREVAEVNWNE